ncbi:hypothetical protein PVAND_007530 [Polypedilum vanderplanki]|uniref:Kinesin motor domain-containing protein n=1 Tax=Polypedilum vanderplanki TaxID=319348 RepID=A0A9J6C6Y3_POLVA|nr:hypothetical protein PVAND_007530 [Polypedilum vanderplanki]
MSSTDCVKVAVRVRPLVEREISRGCVQIVEKTPGEPQISITGESNSKTQDSYTFNNVFMPEDSQDKVYNDCITPILGKLFEGYNVTILAYGQTGSGKTHTMGTVFDGEWDASRVGIIPRALKDIFKTVQTMENDYTVSVSCSFMELYQEVLFDLLTDRPREQSVCEIREDGTKGIIINGLCEIPANDENKANNCLILGGSKRTVGATAMNDVSSRSHAIFIVNVRSQKLDGSESTSAKFTLVDLAGSERSKKTKATGTRFKEGVKINQGLLALGNVISALGGGSSGGYISYRDSKLTRLLQDSLGGNSVTLMVACISPADYNIEETLSTLRYADRAKKIKNKPIKNEDSHSAEVKKLNAIIQELRVQLLTKDNGRVDSGNQNDKENKNFIAIKDNEISDLRQKLNCLMNSINDLNAVYIINDTFINDIIAEFEKLDKLLTTTCVAEFAMPDTKIFEEIKQHIKIINEIVKKYKQQVHNTPENDNLVMNLTDDIDKQKYHEFTNNQIEMFSKITSLEREMKIKQELLDRKYQNVPILNEDTDKTMIEYEDTIKALEKEIAELKSAKESAAARRDHNATKVNMDRKHKLEKLEKELVEIRKKCAQLEKTKKIAEQDRKRCEDLKKEIQEMKTARVQLLRQQRSESEMYKRWISNRDKEINCLKEKGKKAQNEMKRMERLHEKQQAVLKRKFEEAKAINKRLQDAVDRSRNNRKSSVARATEKTDVVQTYIDHELTVIVSTVDANNAMQSLMNDRGLLIERLQNLKSTVNKSESMEGEIKQLEEDLDMRNAQITDMRGKLLETDIEAKLKSIPENFASLGELRIAMGYILRAFIESREDFIVNKTKCEDLKAIYDASEERVEQLTLEKEELIAAHDAEKNRMERDFEKKISYLCQTKNSNISKEEENNIFASLTEQLAAKIDECSAQKSRIEELEKQLNDKKSLNKKKKEPLARTPNGTFIIDDDDDLSCEEISDDEDEFNFDDSFKDPDWIKTPKEKRLRNSRATTTLLKESLVNRLDGTNMLANISESSETSGTKRTSSGATKCTCKGSCATKMCGCKKINNFCSDNCKCSTACVNIPSVSKESIDEENTSSADDKVIKSENRTPERDYSKVDFTNITTPYYPYQNKKRRPLLPIDN